VVVLAAFSIRVTSLEAQSMWRDEVDALCYAYGFPQALRVAIAPGAGGTAAPPCACPPTPISTGEEEAASSLSRLFEALRGTVRQNGPLYFFLLRGWIALAGTSVTALRFFSLWFGVLGVALTYGLGRRLLGHVPGLLAALLVSCSPYLTWYSQEIKMYTMVPALTLLAVYALRRAMEAPPFTETPASWRPRVLLAYVVRRAVEGESGRWWLVQIVATTLALYTHVWSALLVPVLALQFLVWWPRRRGHWLGGLISLALLTLPYLPLAIWQAQRVFVERETGFPPYTLGEMAQLLLTGWGTGVFAWAWPWGGIACGVAVLFGLLPALLPSTSGTRSAASLREPSAGSPPAGKGNQRWMAAVGLLGWVVLPLLGIWFVSRWQPLFTDRYLIWAAPAFYLLAGAGLAFLWHYGRWPMVPLLAAVLLVFVGNLRMQAVQPLKSDFRGAAAFVGERYDSDDLLIFQIPHGRYTFDYYFGPTEYAWEDGLYTNHVAGDGSYLMSEDETAARMTGMTWPYERVWLITSESAMWDTRGLVETWLDAHGTPLAQASFMWVEVTLYALPAVPSG
jgi:mannosyltransferase